MYHEQLLCNSREGRVRKMGGTAMNVRNCRKCGKIFNYAIGPIICPACKDAMEAKFKEVKEYVQNNRNATVGAVSEACDVEPTQIQHWIREERLQFADDSPIKVSCESCGTMIGSGRFCQQCKNNMVKDLNGAIRQPKAVEPEMKKKPHDKNKMRFI